MFLLDFDDPGDDWRLYWTYDIPDGLHPLQIVRICRKGKFSPVALGNGASCSMVLASEDAGTERRRS
jgi:hypothetical protein